MPRSRSFMQVDVFSTSPCSGNPVAVVLDGTGLSDEEMRGLARGTNLSETTFLLPPTVPEADYRVRIFTPGGELPFAGHPTLGSARAWLEGGGTPQDDERIVQECGVGLVTVRRGEDVLSFAAPPRVREGALDEDQLLRFVGALGIKRDQVVAHEWVDNGPGWAVVRLATAAEVLALEPDFSLMPDAMVGAIGAHPDGSRHAFEMRTFAPGARCPRGPRLRQHERRCRPVAHLHRRRARLLPGLPGHEAGPGREHRGHRRRGRHGVGQRRGRRPHQRHHYPLTGPPRCRRRRSASSS